MKDATTKAERAAQPQTATHGEMPSGNQVWENG